MFSGNDFRLCENPICGDIAEKRVLVKYPEGETVVKLCEEHAPGEENPDCEIVGENPHPKRPRVVSRSGTDGYGVIVGFGKWTFGVFIGRHE